MNELKPRFEKHLSNVDWAELRKHLIDDNFHNGRTVEQLRLSFENSAHCVMAYASGKNGSSDRNVKSECIGTARALSDGIGNAYVVDVWTHSRLRRQGVGKQLMLMLLEEMPGQHVYLKTDDSLEFYTDLGFKPQPEGLFKIVGDYLKA